MFIRLPSDTGLNDSYTWDLHGLCKGAGQEYTATSTTSYDVIKFK